jgi:RHS repeat-associated protein
MQLKSFYSSRCSELGEGSHIYFNARYYDPEVGRFLTEDPSRKGTSWYTYCNNNPLTFTDQTGRLTEEEKDERKAERQERWQKFKERVREVFSRSESKETNTAPVSTNYDYPDATTRRQILFDYRIRRALEAGLNQKYSTWDCDAWIEKTLREAGVDIVERWGAAEKTKVAGHIANLEGQTQSAMPERFSIVMMDQGTLDPHAGVVERTSEGRVILYHSTKSVGESTTRDFASQEAFEAEYKTYGRFSYWPIR